MQHRSSKLVGIFMVLLVICLGGAAEAQPQETRSPHEAEVTPITSVAPPLLTITISYAGEAPVELTTRSGGLVTYKSLSYRESFGVIANLLDPDTGAVEIRLVDLGGERPHYRPGLNFDLLHTQLGHETVGTARSALPIAIEVERTDEKIRQHGRGAALDGAGGGCSPPEPPTSSTAASKSGIIPLVQGTTCCVSCDGGEWCGCSVTTNCGSCKGSC